MTTSVRVDAGILLAAAWCMCEENPIHAQQVRDGTWLCVECGGLVQREFKGETYLREFARPYVGTAT